MCPPIDRIIQNHLLFSALLSGKLCVSVWSIASVLVPNSPSVVITFQYMSGIGEVFSYNEEREREREREREGGGREGGRGRESYRESREREREEREREREREQREGAIGVNSLAQHRPQAKLRENENGFLLAVKTLSFVSLRVDDSCLLTLNC